MSLTKNKIRHIRNRLFLPMSYQTSMEKTEKVSSFQMMWALLKGRKFGYVFLIVGATISTLVDFSWSAVFAKWLVSVFENSEGGRINVIAVIPALFCFGLAWVFGDTFYRIGAWYYAKTFEPTLDAKIKISYINRVMKNSYEYFISSSTGRISSGLYRVLFSIKCMLKRFARSVFPTIATCIILVVSLCFVHWSLGVLTILFIIGYFLTFIFTYKKIFFLQKRATDAYTRTTTAITDIIMNFQSVIFFSRKNYELARTKKIQNFESKRIGKTGTYLEALKIVRVLLGFFLCFVLFYADAFYLYHLNKISVSDILYAVGVNGSCYGIMCMLHEDLLDMIADFGLIQEGLNIINEGKVADGIQGGEKLKISKGDISFNDLYFSYGQNNVFSGTNLSIKSGEKIGLVGRSGAGKTTLVNLLLRNLSPTQGKVLIDGQDIKYVSDESLKNSISIVSQDTTLFNRSVLENIRYSKPNATMEEIIEASKIANAHDFIMKLEYGYDTNVGEKGMRLSGGQRQRILIARAMLKNSPILILDEATSALDAENEKSIQESLENLMQGKTVIAIAHKLNTLKKMDKILVLKNGCVVQQGTHNELMTQEGLYKELWNIQCEAVLKEE